MGGYRLTLLNLAAYVVFTVYSFVFFVYLPLFNGVVATTAFGLAALSMAREGLDKTTVLPQGAG